MTLFPVDFLLLGKEKSTGSDVIKPRGLHHPIADQESQPDVDINQSATGKLNRMRGQQVSCPEPEVTKTKWPIMTPQKRNQLHTYTTFTNLKRRTLSCTKRVLNPTNDVARLTWLYIRS